MSEVTRIDFENPTDMSFIDKYKTPQVPNKPPCDRAIETFHDKLKNMRSLDWATLNIMLGKLFESFDSGEPRDGNE